MGLPHSPITSLPARNATSMSAGRVEPQLASILPAMRSSLSCVRGGKYHPHLPEFGCSPPLFLWNAIAGTAGGIQHGRIEWQLEKFADRRNDRSGLPSGPRSAPRGNATARVDAVRPAHRDDLLPAEHRQLRLSVPASMKRHCAIAPSRITWTNRAAETASRAPRRCWTCCGVFSHQRRLDSVDGEMAEDRIEDRGETAAGHASPPAAAQVRCH